MRRACAVIFQDVVPVIASSAELTRNLFGEASALAISFDSVRSFCCAPNARSRRALEGCSPVLHRRDFSHARAFATIGLHSRLGA
jgi:hypothetical protein